MSDNELPLAELIKLRDQYRQDVADLKNELRIVECATPKNISVLEEMKNYPENIFKQAFSKSYSNINTNELTVTDTKLIYYYKTLTDVQINNISVNLIPNFEKDTLDKCWWSYEINANIKTLYFYINYISNKPPDNNSEKKNEIFKNFIVKLSKPYLQKEIQNGLDFFSKNPASMENLIIFLKTVQKLNEIRRNTCKDLMDNFKDFIEIGIIEDTGQVCLICKGVLNPNDIFMLHWQIKWNYKMLSARDSFKIEVNFSDKSLMEELKPILNKICDNSIWSKTPEENKMEYFRNIINLIQQSDLNYRSGNSSLIS